MTHAQRSGKIRDGQQKGNTPVFARCRSLSGRGSSGRSLSGRGWTGHGLTGRGLTGRGVPQNPHPVRARWPRARPIRLMTVGRVPVGGMIRDSVGRAVLGMADCVRLRRVAREVGSGHGGEARTSRSPASCPVDVMGICG